MFYNRCTGIYRYGNNTDPRRIRRRSNLGHIFRKNVRLMGREIRYLDPNLSQINPPDKIRYSFYKIKFSTTYFKLLQYVCSIYVISGFRRDVRSSLFWDVTQSWEVVIYQHFGTTCRSHLQGLSNSDVVVSNKGTTLIGRISDVVRSGRGPDLVA